MPGTLGRKDVHNLTMNPKTIPLMVSLTLLAPAAFAATPAVTSAQSEYDKAVKSYVDAATDELRAIRVSVDAQLVNANDATKARYGKVYADLDECDKLLAELKKSGPADFDRVKLNLELTRGKALKDFSEAQKL